MATTSRSSGNPMRRHLDYMIRIGLADEVADLVWAMGDYMEIDRDRQAYDLAELNAAAIRVKEAYIALERAYDEMEAAIEDCKRGDHEPHPWQGRADGLGGVA